MAKTAEPLGRKGQGVAPVRVAAKRAQSALKPVPAFASEANERAFWEAHDPTTLNRQGPDVGSQYRSAIFAQDDIQAAAARASKAALEKAGRFRRPIVTEIVPAPQFYYAEDYHQQYLAKNPDGYCGHGGTGVSCPIGVKL